MQRLGRHGWYLGRCTLSSVVFYCLRWNAGVGTGPLPAGRGQLIRVRVCGVEDFGNWTIHLAASDTANCWPVRQPCGTGITMNL